MEPKNTQNESTQDNQVDKALSIVELEERFELTVAAADATRCTIDDVSVA
jgi:hypothetical protein